MRNVANTFTSFFTNTNTASRIYTLKDTDGTVAFISDITGTNSGTNTGDQTTIVGITGTTAQFNTALTDGDFATLAGTETLTNKRITKRNIVATSYTTSTTINSDATDIYTITAQAGALLFNNPTGTPTDGQMVLVRMKDNGTARALTYGTNFASGTATLATTTVLSKWLLQLFEWNSTDSKWYCQYSGSQA